LGGVTLISGLFRPFERGLGVTHQSERPPDCVFVAALDIHRSICVLVCIVATKSRPKSSRKANLKDATHKLHLSVHSNSVLSVTPAHYIENGLEFDAPIPNTMLSTLSYE
jgi:hypothetical protein